MNILSIFINDQLVFEYDRATELDDKKLMFLDRMDSDMDRGFKIFGEMISEPDNRQKATFVAMSLLRALQQEEQAKIAVSCAYLSNRLPHMVELHAKDHDNRIDIEFIETH